MGIGPLHYDENYVTKGKADARLSGDLHFMATRMGVVCPPLHIAHPKEKKMFNGFMEENPRPTGRDWRAWSKRFLDATDCKHVFPKLPSMLKSYYNRWKDSQMIVMLKEATNTEYQSLLTDLAQPARGSSAGVQRQQAVAMELVQDTETDQDFINLPDDPLPVAPFVAPGQDVFVNASNGTRRDQRCCMFPKCTKMASECNGWKPGDCTEVSSGRVEQPTTEEREEFRLARKAAACSTGTTGQKAYKGR